MMDAILFETQAEAATICNQLAAEHKEDQAARAEKRKQYGKKSYTWAAGYHTRKIERCERQLAWHQKLVQVCQAKSKQPIKENTD